MRKEARENLKLRQRFADGELRLDGTDLVPLNFLWYETAVVAAHMRHAMRVDLVLVTMGKRGLVLVVRCHDDLAELECKNAPEFTRFDKVDRIFSRYGLLIVDLGDPMFSTHPMNRPKAVAA